MRAHINTHLLGTSVGEVPPAWLQQNGLVRCLVCGCTVSQRLEVHPTCRPAARDANNACGAAQVPALHLPSLADIQTARTPTLRHVPSSARHAWHQALVRALSAVAHVNDEQSWIELLMLPQCVLCAPLRGGRKHRRATAAFVSDRLQRWAEGERLHLWDSRPKHNRKSTPSLTPEERRDLATGWAREGFDHKACKALLAEGLCPPTVESAAALAALHPHSPPPASQPVQSLPVAPEVAPELVTRSLRACRPETAPGPTGLRVQHLRDACVAGGVDSLIAQLTAVVNVLAQGRAPASVAPASVAPVLAGAGLVALAKPAGGLRPIAVGELLRRLTGKCLMTLVREEARAFFWPAQVGVAVKGGAETAVHAARAWTQRHMGSTHKVLVKLDFSNAFNCVDRTAVLQQCCANFPVLARWATWCYQQPTRLQFGDRVLESSSGVQQGDPLGPLLFAAATQPLACELRLGPLDLAVHFLDDGLLAGDAPAVGAGLAHVRERAAALGLTLNLSKCEVVVLGPVDLQSLQLHLPNALLQNADGSCRVQRNFEFLGAAIGDDAFVQSHTEARAAKAQRLLDEVGQLADPQVALRLLRACAGFARMVHSMRCNPPHAQMGALAAFDGMVRSCFAEFTGIHATAEQWSQAARGFAQAGLGLRSCVTHAPGAYLASLGSSLAACLELDPAFSALQVTSAPSVAAALDSLNAQLPAPEAMSLEAAWSSSQRNLSKRVDDCGWAGQLARSTPAECAGLRSEAGPGARAFLSALPCGKGRFEPAGFLRSSAFAWECRMLRKTHGALCVTRCWTFTVTVPACVLRAASARFGATPLGTWSSLGPSEPGSGRRRSARVCFCHKALMIPSLQGAGLPMSTCPPWVGLLLPSTLLSQHPSDRRRSSWRARRLVQRPKPMQDTRKATLTQLRPVRIRA